MRSDREIGQYLLPRYRCGIVPILRSSTPHLFRCFKIFEAFIPRQVAGIVNPQVESFSFHKIQGANPCPLGTSVMPPACAGATHRSEQGYLIGDVAQSEASLARHTSSEKPLSLNTTKHPIKIPHTNITGVRLTD